MLRGNRPRKVVVGHSWGTGALARTPGTRGAGTWGAGAPPDGSAPPDEPDRLDGLGGRDGLDGLGCVATWCSKKCREPTR